MQFSFFIFPFGSTRLLKSLGKDYDSSSILNVLAKPHFKYRNKKYKNLLWADKQIFFSVLFHSLIYKEYFIGQIHQSHLTYIFNGNLTLEEIETKLVKNHQISPIFEKDFSENTCLKIALERLTEEAIFTLKRWPVRFTMKLYNYLAELPLRFRISKEIIHINDINYPMQIKALSIYVLLTGKFSNDEKLKIKSLHTLGLRNIGNLLIFNPDYNLIENS